MGCSTGALGQTASTTASGLQTLELVWSECLLPGLQLVSTAISGSALRRRTQSRLSRGNFFTFFHILDAALDEGLGRSLTSWAVLISDSRDFEPVRLGAICRAGCELQQSDLLSHTHIRLLTVTKKQGHEILHVITS